MKKYFLTGLVSLLPLAMTIWIAKFVIELLTSPFVGLLTNAAHLLPPVSQQIVLTLSRLLILISLLLFILFLGFIARQIFFKSLIKLGDRLLAKIPIVNKIYKTSKEITKTFFNTNEKTFSQTVIYRFPNPNCYSVGLVAKKAPAACSKAGDPPLVSVFLPMALNPTTGFLVMAKEEELIYLDMKADEALKYVLSCGVILPRGDKL